MKFGVKTFDSEELFDYFKDKADFFEIQAIQTNNYDFLKKYKKPIIVHAEHTRWGINPANKEIEDKNLKSINFAINLANQINSKYIIFHSGKIEDENCTKSNSIEFFKKLNNKRIITENYIGDSNGICTNPANTKEFMKETGCGLCFDINHAIASANIQNKDYLDFIKEFIKLNPVHYHIGGQIMSLKGDCHISFSSPDSDINLKKIIKLLPKEANITIETSQIISEVEYDLNLLKSLV